MAREAVRATVLAGVRVSVRVGLAAASELGERFQQLQDRLREDPDDPKPPED